LLSGHCTDGRQRHLGFDHSRQTVRNRATALLSQSALFAAFLVGGLLVVCASELRHFVYSVDFPDDPVTKVIEEICYLHHAHRPIHISGQVTHFVSGVLPGWLAWFRVLT
ncbi:hypothetical protein, partial [Pseudomonas sp. PA-4-8C]|uniref:hypothetical protein n=1 Tax=Pseudomonas sp. PA-4-8C TaxID=2665476 RepID=UPI001F3D9614